MELYVIISTKRALNTGLVFSLKKEKTETEM